MYSPAFLDRLQAIDPQPWDGTIFRHMFGDRPPDRENTRGARWNPSETQDTDVATDLAAGLRDQGWGRVAWPESRRLDGLAAALEAAQEERVFYPMARHRVAR